MTTEDDGIAGGSEPGDITRAQVVFGHLLPHYQAAQEWQDTVRAQRVLQTVVAGGPPSDEPAVVRVRHDAMRQWRALWGTVGKRVAVTTHRAVDEQQPDGAAVNLDRMRSLSP